MSRIPASNPTYFPTGEVIADSYEILGLLGEGGMAQVYEAKDLVLGRRVAIKVTEGPPFAENLLREGRALAAITHPSLPTVFAAGEVRGKSILVMERLLGRSLAAHIEQRLQLDQPFEIVEAVGILTAIAQGLDAIHRAGVAHQDIKPDNIMLTGTGRVVLLDFGLVAPFYDNQKEKLIAGSPHFMAPEVFLEECSGEGRIRADLYSLGVTAFELLSGTVPYDADTPQMVIQQHISVETPDVRSRRSDVPADLALLLQDLMAKDPNDRPDSVESVLWQLSRIQRRASTPPRPIRCLIVAHDRDVHSQLNANLEAAYPALTINTAHNAKEALAACTMEYQDLMLLDLELPQIHGMELVMMMRGMDAIRDTTVVVIGHRIGSEDKRVLRHIGVEHFVDKDASMVEGATDAVGEILSSPKLARR